MNLEDVRQERMVDFIRKVVCDYYRVPEKKLSTKTRKAEVILCKHMVVYFTIHRLPQLPYERIAHLTGYNGDHSMMIFIRKKIDGYCSWDKKIVHDIQQMNNKIQAQALDKSRDELEEMDFINLNDLAAVRVNMNKAIVLVGYSEPELLEVRKRLGLTMPIVRYENTGMYLFNKKKDNDNGED